MRVALEHNENAGGGVSADEVRRVVEAAGHEIVADLAPSQGLALAAGAELLVVAGGDGTFRSAALAAVGSGLPLAALPLGTANNIATTLGMDGDLERVVRSWETARRVPLDAGVARGAFGVRRFLESAGAGLVAQGIATMDAEAPHPEEGDRYEMLRKASQRFGEVLADSRPRRSRLALDGEEAEGELLLVEVLNICSVGPRLRFAPSCRVADGLFDVVVAGEEQRGELARYLRERALGSSDDLRLPLRRAARVSFDGWDTVHLDDQVLEARGEPVTVEVERGVVEVLSAAPEK